VGDAIGSGPETLTGAAREEFVGAELLESVDEAEFGDPPHATRTMPKLRPAAKPRAISLRLRPFDGLVPTDSPDLMAYPPLEALQPPHDYSCQVWHSLPHARASLGRGLPGLASAPD
jgi:hypothetical protein